MIAIAGSTGFVGRHLAARLAGEQESLRCLVRDPARAAASLPPNIATARADLLDPESLERALAGVDTVVHCAAITADRKDAPAGSYWQVNVEGTRNLVAAAQRAGVRAFVLLNGLGTQPGKPGSYMRTRWEMGEAVRGSGLPWVAVQPSVLFGDNAPFIAAFARIARWSPVMPMVGGGSLKLQMLWVEDLVTCLARCARERRWDGQAFDLGGPEHLTFSAVVDLMLMSLRLRRLKAPLPLPLARVQARLLSVLPNPPLVPAALELFDFDNITDLDAIPRRFGFQPRRMGDHFRDHGLAG
jgi:NADH dehydrogenase